MEIASSCHGLHTISVGSLKSGAVFMYLDNLMITTDIIKYSEDTVVCIGLWNGKSSVIRLSTIVFPRPDLHLAPIKEVSS